MMLVRSSIDVHLPSVPNLEKQEIFHVWIQDNQSWQQQKQEHEQPIPIQVTNRTNQDESSSQLSTEVNMSETSKPNLVYKRRTIHRNDQIPKPTLVYKRKKVQTGCCSSSKSNMEIGSVSLKQQTDDVGECSSSVVVKDLSETNSCIAFLGRHLLLENKKGNCFNKSTNIENSICDLRACKVCERSTLTLKMLICDLCEESFHMSCCNPVVKKVPKGDWFCHFCSRKKLTKMKETNSGKSPKGYFGPIMGMLKDVDSYKSDVRIGEDFQAEVPEWCGPLIDELNDYNEPLEISPDFASYQASNKLSRLSSIGNWLQCRDNFNGNICGKWRRAPLFEVQTDNWECFSSAMWDPSHADCAVPQELDTDQVLKQLKYIEMLRPRLSAKRWKLGVHKGVNQEEHTGDPRNTQKL